MNPIERVLHAARGEQLGGWVEWASQSPQLSTAGHARLLVQGFTRGLVRASGSPRLIFVASAAIEATRWVLCAGARERDEASLEVDRLLLAARETPDAAASVGGA